MYVRPSHKLSPAAAKDIVMTYERLSLVITSVDGQAEATQLPLYYEDGKLIGHIARANPHWKIMAKGMPVLIIMQGPDAYITPNSYPSKAVDGKVVPTWNYQRVDIRGRISTFEDPARLLEAVSIITDKFEIKREQPWRVADAPQDFTTRLLRSIIGIEIEIDSILGKSKMDQDEPTANQQGVIDTLNQSADQLDHGVASLMAANLDAQNKL